jgi:uncharacterized protein YciI
MALVRFEAVHTPVYGVESEGTVEYFFYCRDTPGTELLLEKLAHAHWSFMDGYADAMIARGPTLTPDRKTHTGSMHMVDLPDDEAARAFAFEEPYYAAGVYGEVLMRRWRNELGRAMWDFRGGADDPRFLIIGHGREGASAAAEALLEEHRRYFVDRGYDGQLIERGPLLSDDGMEWAGSRSSSSCPTATPPTPYCSTTPMGWPGCTRPSRSTTGSSAVAHDIPESVRGGAPTIAVRPPP